MKIFMRNIGMTLHVIHKLRAEGIDNIQVNMDWQHLLMNGEHLPEYAALLAAEGLLGHQHANSGWGIFDDDNMVGATAFMETVELAIELRRADYGANGERLGFDLYPYTEDQVAAVKRSVEQWHFIDEVGQRIDGDAAARGAAAQGRRRRLRARLRRAGRARTVARMTRLLGLDVGTSSVKGIAIDGDGAVLAVAERGYPLSTPRPGWSEQDPEDWWRGAAEVLEELDAANAAGIGLSGQMHGLVALDEAARPLRPAILWNDGRTQAQCEEIEERIGFERLVELTGNRALAGFTAPKLLWLAEHEPEVYGRIAHILLPKDYVRLKLTDEHAIDVADASGTLLFDVAERALERRGRPRARRRSRVAAEGLRVARHHRRDPRRRAGRRRRGRPGRRRARRRRGGRGRPGVRRARHERRRLRRPGPLRARSRRRACTPSATPCRRRGTSWA